LAILEEQFEQTEVEKEKQKIYTQINQLEKLQKQLPKLYIDDRPFASPFYWAAFICQGLR